MEEDKLEEITPNLEISPDLQKEIDFVKKTIEKLWRYQNDKLMGDLNYDSLQALEKASWLFSLKCAARLLDWVINIFIEGVNLSIDSFVDSKEGEFVFSRHDYNWAKEIDRKIYEFQTCLNIGFEINVYGGKEDVIDLEDQTQTDEMMEDI